jgi:hypothetical protein
MNLTLFLIALSCLMLTARGGPSNGRTVVRALGWAALGYMGNCAQIEGNTMKELWAAGAMAIALPCFAQSGLSLTPDVCKVFSREQLMDTSQFMSWEFKYNQHHEMVCRNTQQDTETKFNMASSFSAVVNYVPLGGSGALDFSRKKAEIENYCRYIEKLSQDEKRVAFSSTSFGNNMAAVTTACLDVIREGIKNSHGILAYSSPNNSTLTEFMVTIEPKPRREMGDVSITGYTATSNTLCYSNGKALSLPMQPIKLSLDAQNTFLCSKPGTDGTYITFHTSSMGDTDKLWLPGQNDTKLMSVQSQIDSLTSLLAVQSSRKIVLEDCDYPTGAPYDQIGVAWGMEGKTNVWNRLDKHFEASCPAGKTIVGLDSGHHNSYEDRQFRFKCCSVVLK